MFHFYLILSLCVVASCNQDDELLQCKPKPGCFIARCDPRPAGQWFGNDGVHDDYPILCQQNEASSPATAVTELVNKFDEIRTDFVKLEGRLERSEKLEFDMNTEITYLKKTNGEMRNEMDNVKKEAEENKGKLNGALKEIAFLGKNKVEMKGKINRLEIEANGSKRKMNDAMIQIDLLKKKNEKDVEESKVKTKDLIKRIVSLENENAGKRMENRGMSEKETSPKTGNKNHTTTVLCPVIYENKCFIPPVIGREISYDDGVAVCKSLGGHLANIYSQTHMDDVMKYIRENRLGVSSFEWFRLGMKYDPKAKKFTLRDGADAPAGLKWTPGYPLTVEASAANADRTSVILGVQSDQSQIHQYLYNYPPWYPFYVLCEIE